jgi:3-oxoacyl-[acyl-carrier-protein] synthase II
MAQVVVTGIGVISPLGDSLAELHSSLCAGKSGIGPIEAFSTAGCECQLAAQIKSFDTLRYLGKINLRPLDRTGALAASAARLALNDSGWSSEMLQQVDVGLVLGTMFGGLHTISEFDRRALQAGPWYASPMDFANTVINAAAGQTAIRHNLRGVNSTISTGPTSGLQAVAYATDMIQSGRMNAILAGGAEEFCFESFYNFDRSGFLCAGNPNHQLTAADAKRNGLVLGEGASLLMLENEQSAHERGARVLAEISGHASGFDPSQGNNFIDVIARTVELALSGSGVTADSIDCISSSANGIVACDTAEAEALAKVCNGRLQSVPVTAIKSLLGDALGASGALQIAAMIGTMCDGVIPCSADLGQKHDRPINQHFKPRFGLINSIGFDGQCCSLILKNYNETND